MVKPCCGQAVRRWRKAPSRPKLPPNPKVARGVKLIYIGSGQRTIKGSASKLKYHLSDYRRHFVADPGDVDSILRSKYFMIEP